MVTKIKSLSFCIPACGIRETLLERAINSIHLQKIDIPYAILVYGKTNLDTKIHRFIYKHNSHDPDNGRVSSMLNRLAEMSRSEFLVYIGDDQELIYRWWPAVKQLNPDLFDLTVFPCYQFELNRDPVEWYSWQYLKGTLHRKKWNEPADQYTFIGGGCLIVRREAALKIKYDEKFGRGGDYLFGFACYKAGYKLKAFPFMRHAYTIHYLAPAPHRVGEKKS